MIKSLQMKLDRTGHIFEKYYSVPKPGRHSLILTIQVKDNSRSVIHVPWGAKLAVYVSFQLSGVVNLQPGDLCVGPSTVLHLPV